MAIIKWHWHSTLCQRLSRCLAAFIMPLELQTILTSYQNEMQPTSCLCHKTHKSDAERQPDRQTLLYRACHNPLGERTVMGRAERRKERALDRRQVYLCYDLNTANDSQTWQHLSGGTADI